jgi:hypothetical protein
VNATRFGQLVVVLDDELRFVEVALVFAQDAHDGIEDYRIVFSEAGMQ